MGIGRRCVDACPAGGNRAILQARDMSGIGEDEIVARLFAPIAGAAGLELKDDVALIAPPPGREIALTVDALVAGVHFFADDPPEAIAAKALRVNLSDLASKGAAPLGFLLTLALPEGVSEDWLTAFAAALGEDARLFGCPLIGGDTVRTPGPLTLSITALGAIAPGRLPTRMGARPGDALYVTGSIGDAALGLQMRLGRAPALGPDQSAFLLGRYLKPEPRLALAPALRHARAAMDVSDGLVGDLAKMLRASGHAGELDLARVPFSPAARAWFAADAGGVEIAATGGDDYEVLAAVGPAEAAAFEAQAAAAGVPVHAVGAVIKGVAGDLAVTGLDGARVVFARGSFSHF